MTYIETLGIKAQQAKKGMMKLGTQQKNDALLAVAQGLIQDTDAILEANTIDMARGIENGMDPGLLDRLKLDASRIEGIAQGLEQIASLPDPIGEILSMQKRPNGLMIGQKRVPIGVIGIIFEARPNVSADAFGLCFKTNNVVILKGGKDAIHSIQALCASIRHTLEVQGFLWMRQPTSKRRSRSS